MRLIDADAIPYKKIMFDDDEDDFYYGVTQPYIDRMPTIDAVPVVRCRECAWRGNHWTGCPKLRGLETPDDFYCGFGERGESRDK